MTNAGAAFAALCGSMPKPDVVSKSSAFVSIPLRRAQKSCGHYCYPSNLSKCCACEDLRPIADGYKCYVDGIGYTLTAAREDGYCPVCNTKSLDAKNTKETYNLKPPPTCFSNKSKDLTMNIKALSFVGIATVVVVGTALGVYFGMRAKSIETVMADDPARAITFPLLASTFDGADVGGSATLLRTEEPDLVVRHSLIFRNFTASPCANLTARLEGGAAAAVDIDITGGGAVFTRPLPIDLNVTSYDSISIICGDTRGDEGGTDDGGNVFGYGTLVEMPPEKTEMVLKTGAFSGSNDYIVEGIVKIGRSMDTVDSGLITSYFLIFEDIEVSAGPDVVLYLSPGTDARNVDGALEISIDGRPAGTFSKEGSFSQDLPDGFDPARYNSVVVWCRRFGVLFGTASLE